MAQLNNVRTGMMAYMGIKETVQREQDTPVFNPYAGAIAYVDGRIRGTICYKYEVRTSTKRHVHVGFIYGTT